MKRILLTASMFSLLTLGCGHTLLQPAAEEPQQAAQAKAEPERDQADVAPSSTDERTAGPSSATALRQPGDFVVYRFSGSYRSSPVTVTHRVIERDDETLVVDVTVKDGAAPAHFRLRIHDAPNEAGEILSVALIVGSTERPIGISAYEALMEKTMLPIDHNEALIDRAVATVHIGSATFPCQKSSYRVFAKGRPATMTIFESPQFAWGDLGGEILSADGRLLYKAAIVEVGGPTSAPEEAVVAQGDEEADDWYEYEE